MKIHQANYQSNRIGGGWTFANYFANYFGQSDYIESDIYFVTSASMTQRHEVEQAKTDGKKIVLRVDNAIRNSRNRNTGMTRMYDFAKLADVIVYQSEWSKQFLKPFLKKDGLVILNGVDTDKFKPASKPEDNTYLYARSSRDEGKQWIMAWYWFVNHSGFLEIVGKFSGDNIDFNFDFYNNERYRFMGEQNDMLDVYRRNKYFLYSYLNDACSNTLLEAKATGCEIIDVYGMLKTGGAPEIMACEDISLARMFKQYKEALK
jgi:glycosyltransferase involved in cell wall biosynthesis